jgi:ubiquinone/menaquinone biosynthesis C-methylase UbiE
MNVIARLLAKKFRKPTGFLGRLIGMSMTRRNAREAKWTVSLLNIQPHHHILEVGFGSGLAIQHASQETTQGLVAGVDYSETMVQVASKRNISAIKSGHVALKLGEVSSLPFPDASFDSAYTIHCIYFWDQPFDGLKEIKRILKPSGLLAVTIMPKDKWPKELMPPLDIFRLYNSDEVARLLSEAGFREVRVELYPRPEEFPVKCVLGIK